jgi:hypothetical protein
MNVRVNRRAQAEHLETGCCGLAGNFGFQVGHGEVSKACAGRALLSRLREAAPGAVVLADGFSCRTQIHELDSGGREAMHLAELLPQRAASPRRPAGRSSASAQPGEVAPVHQESAAYRAGGGPGVAAILI